MRMRRNSLVKATPQGTRLVPNKLFQPEHGSVLRWMYWAQFVVRMFVVEKEATYCLSCCSIGSHLCGMVESGGRRNSQSSPGQSESE